MSEGPTHKGVMESGLASPFRPGGASSPQDSLENGIFDWNEFVDPEMSLEEYQTSVSPERQDFKDDSLNELCDFLNNGPVAIPEFYDDLSKCESSFDRFDQSVGFIENNNCSIFEAGFYSTEFCSNSLMSVSSTTDEKPKHVLQDQKFDYMLQTKVAFNSADDPITKKRKKVSKKSQEVDEDYVADDDYDDRDDEDDDYEFIPKKSTKKRRRKKSWDSDEGGYSSESKKRIQNKRAATKYRNKKKQQDASNEAKLEQLSSRNAELKRLKEEKEQELHVLKRILNDFTHKKASQGS